MIRKYCNRIRCFLREFMKWIEEGLAAWVKEMEEGLDERKKR